MGEENNIDKLFRSGMEPMNVNPPDRSRMAIDAELDKRRAVLYDKKINNYRIVAAVLALLLVSFAAFYFIEPTINKENVTSTVKENRTEENKNSSEKKIQLNKQSTIGEKEDEGSVIVSENKNADLNTITDEIPSEITINNYRNSIKKINTSASIENNLINAQNKNIELTDVNSVEKELNSFITEAKSTEATIPFNKEFYSIPDKIDIIPINNYQSDLSIEKGLTAKVPVSLFLFYSPNYSYCLLKDNTPDVVDDVQMYKDQETPEFSYSTGFALRYKLSERWGFSAGVTYYTVTKSISLLTVYAAGTEDHMYYAYHTSSGMIEVPDPESSQIKVGDSLNLSGEGEKILKFVNVPLMARYVISKEKINWFVNGGLSVNFLVQDQVRISTTGSDETVKNKTQGLKKLSYGFVIGAGIEYKLFNNLNLVFEPVYKGTFTSITEDAAVKNYPFSVGINLGASINF